jgi:hypothetical protein
VKPDKFATQLTLKSLAELDRGENESTRRTVPVTTPSATALPFLGSIDEKNIKDKVFIKNFDMVAQRKDNVMNQIDPNAPLDLKSKVRGDMIAAKIH